MRTKRNGFRGMDAMDRDNELIYRWYELGCLALGWETLSPEDFVEQRSRYGRCRKFLDRYGRWRIRRHLRAQTPPSPRRRLLEQAILQAATDSARFDYIEKAIAAGRQVGARPNSGIILGVQAVVAAYGEEAIERSANVGRTTGRVRRRG